MSTNYGLVKTNKNNKKKKNVAWYNKKYSALQMAKKALQGVWYLKGLVNAEMKFHQVLSGPTDIDWNGALIPLSDVAQGDTDVTRDGNMISVRYLTVRGTVKIADTAEDATCRIMIVQDFSTEPGTTTISDIFQSSTVGTTYAALGGLNRNTGIRRFKIHASKIITLDHLSHLTQTFYFNIAVRSHVYFDGAAATDRNKGAFFLVHICDKDPTGATNPTITVASRLKFRDN